MGRHQGLQLANPGQPIGDPPSREHAAILVEQAQVMVGLAPVHPDKQHRCPPLLRRLVVEPEKDLRRLMAVLCGTTSHQPSALLNTSRGTRSPESSGLLTLRVLTDRWLRPTSHQRLVRPH